MANPTFKLADTTSFMSYYFKEAIFSVWPNIRTKVEVWRDYLHIIWNYTLYFPDQVISRRDSVSLREVRSSNYPLEARQNRIIIQLYNETRQGIIGEMFARIQDALYCKDCGETVIDECGECSAVKSMNKFAQRNLQHLYKNT